MRKNGWRLRLQQDVGAAPGGGSYEWTVFQPLYLMPPESGDAMPILSATGWVLHIWTQADEQQAHATLRVISAQCASTPPPGRRGT